MTWPARMKMYLLMFTTWMGMQMPQASLQMQPTSNPIHRCKAVCGWGKGVADAVMAHVPDQGEELHDKHGHQQHHLPASCMH